MSASRSSRPSPAVAEEPTPKPTSAVHTNNPVEQAPASSRRGADRKAALLEYFANPSTEICEIDAAWEAALALYGDEDSDAWIAALEDGTHPLCHLRMPKRSA